MKLWSQASRGQSPLRSHSRFLFPLSFSFSLPSSCPSLPPPLPSLPAATCRQAAVPAISSPAVLPSFLLHKITEAAERKCSGCRVARRPASLPSCSGAQLAAGPCSSRWSACPPPSPASRCGPSAADGAIGKQRLKKNYSVSSSSLMNK